MDRLYRSRRDRWFTGLLGGLGEKFGISPSLLRVLMIFSVFFTGGTTIMIYLIASLVISKEPHIPYDPYFNGWQNQNRGSYNGGNGGFGGPGGGAPGAPGGFGAGNFGGNGRSYGGTFNNGPSGQFSNNGVNSANQGSSDLDSMMKDIEKKAMKKEIEELRKKVSKYEKGEV